MDGLGEEMGKGCDRSSEQRKKQHWLGQRDDRSSDQVGQRRDEAHPTENPSDERCGHRACDERGDELAPEFSLPPSQPIREMSSPRDSGGDESTHSKHAELITDIQCGTRLVQRCERANRPRCPGRCRSLPNSRGHRRAEHRARSQRRRGCSDDSDIDGRSDESAVQRNPTRHPRDLKEQFYRRGDHSDVESGYREHVNQAGRGVAIPHFGGDLPLVSNEERPRERGIVAEGGVDRTTRSCSDPRQNVRGSLLPSAVSGWTVRWRG